MKIAGGPFANQFSQHTHEKGKGVNMRSWREARGTVGQGGFKKQFSFHKVTLPRHFHIKKQAVQKKTGCP